MLCEGDPFVYGSFMYLYAQLADRWPVEVVPGVSSLTACAAVAGVPMAGRNDVLSVIPAPLDAETLAARLQACDAAAIIKPRAPLHQGTDGDWRARPIWVRALRGTRDHERAARAADRSGCGRLRALLLDGAGASPRRGMAVDHPGAALIALTQCGLTLAKRLQPEFPHATVHGLARRTTGADVTFNETLVHLRALFLAGTPIIGICASGILIRAMAPLLSDKLDEPPVVAIAEDGSVAVPLIGGHHGANDIARIAAAANGGIAAVTTASDVRLGVALDDLPPGWRIGSPEQLKTFSSALLAGAPVRLVVDAGDATWLSALPIAANARHTIRVTDRAVAASADELILHPADARTGRRLRARCAAGGFGGACTDDTGRARP